MKLHFSLFTISRLCCTLKFVSPFPTRRVFTLSQRERLSAFTLPELRERFAFTPPKLRERFAFTLLELMLVIGIIAILMVLVAPAFTSIKTGNNVTSAAYTIKGV